MVTALPPSPRIAKPRQVLAWLARPEWLLEQARRECGDAFSLQLPLGPMVGLCHPDDVKAVFTGDPDVLRAGEGNATIEPVVGPESLFVLDGPRHLRRRRLVLPPFHGERLQGYAQDMAQLAAAEVDTWPVGTAFALEPRMRAVTLRIILRVVFGLDDGPRAARLAELIPTLLPDGLVESLALIPVLRRDIGPWRVYGRFVAVRAAVDREIYAEIAERRGRGDLDERADILALLLQARDDEGAPLTDGELRDELMTLLLAGHETTATVLAWTFALLLRDPDALARAEGEARADDAGRGPTPWLDAVVTETLRLKPPVPFAGRVLSQPLTLAGHHLPAGTRVMPCIYLTQRRADVYPQPLAFRPQRFLGAAPETYAWLPFGGGVRRCVGAAFAQLELREVLRTILRAAQLRPATARPERTRRRTVVLVPEHGARVVLVRRVAS